MWVRVAATVAIVSISLLGFGCEVPTVWRDFKGINLIEERGFEAVGDEADPAATAFWQPIAEASDYVVWEEADPTDYPALPTEIAAEPVYRLEAINLLANGDFESDTTGLSTWNSDGTTNATIQTVADFNASTGQLPLASIHNERVLSLTFETAQERFYVDLSDPASLTAPISLDAGETALLAFFVDFRIPGAKFAFSLNSNSETDIQNQIEINRGATNSGETTYRYPGTVLVDKDTDDLPEPASLTGTNSFTLSDENSDGVADYPYLSIGGYTAATQIKAVGVFDNIRLTRADLNLGIELAVPYRDPLQKNRPPLESGGAYTVTFWIARDATTGASNRFDPRYLTVALVGETNRGEIPPAQRIMLLRRTEVNYDPVIVPDDPDTARTRNIYDLESEWTPVSLTFDGFDFGNLDGMSPDSVLIRFQISVGSPPAPAYQYPGSIMIAAPSLQFAP